MKPARYITHITLDTGDSRRSPRDEVSDTAIAALQDGLDAALTGAKGPGIPGQDGYYMTASAEGRCLIATAWRQGPLVTLGVAAHSRCGARLWRQMHDLAYRPAGSPPLATAGRPCPPEPWLAVRIEIGLLMHMDATQWLGDWERCLAWAWLSRQERRS